MRETAKTKRWARIALLSCAFSFVHACSEPANEPDASGPAQPACWLSLEGRGLPLISDAVGFEVGGEYFAAAELNRSDAALLRFDGEDWEVFPLGEGGLGAPVAIWAADPQHVFASTYGEVWSFDGRVARQVLAVEEFAITSLWGFAADDVWVGGYPVSGCDHCEAPATTELYHFDGTRWSAVSTGLVGRIDSLWGAAPDDVWAVGSAILHFDGERWQHVMELSGAQAQVSGAAADAVFIALAEQAPMHFDGVEWRAVVSDGLAPRHVYALPDGSVFAYASSRVGAQSFVLRWNGDAFELSDWTLPAFDAVTQARLSHYGDDLLVLEGSGWLLREDSFELWYEPSPVGGLALTATYPAQPSGLLGVRHGTLVDLVEDRLRPLASADLPVRFDAHDLGAKSADDAWLVGRNSTPQGVDAYHWDGAQLSPLEVPLEGDLEWQQAEVADSGELWIAGIELHLPDAELLTGPVRVLRLDETQWHDASPDLGETSSVGLSITDDQVWVHAPPNIVAVQQDEQWARHDLLDGDRTIQSLSAADNDDVYAVIEDPDMDGGVLMHFDGEAWSAVEAVEDYGVRQVSARGSDDVWVTGYRDDRALVLRFDGDDWSELDTAHFEDFSIAVALGDDRAVFPGDLGTWLYDCDAAR
jgi:hypothetical protein